MADAMQMLRDDHKRVKDLFNQFEAAEDNATKARIVKEALRELEIHADVEEKIFYPAVREEAEAEMDQMDEAEEEHHVAKLLIAELRRMKPGAARFDAKFTVLAKNVRHHIDEEESEMLPKAAELGMARMNELGAEIEQRKEKLERMARTRPLASSRNGASGSRSAKPSAKTTASGAGKRKPRSASGKSPGEPRRAATRTKRR